MSLRDAIRALGTDSLEYFGNGYTHEGGYALQQNPDELAALIYYLYNDYAGKLENYLEIGLGSGGLMRFMHEQLAFRHVCAIDDGKHPRAQEQPHNIIAMDDPEGDLVEVFDGDSHSIKAHVWLSNRGLLFDLAFLDGDHSYEGVLRDLLLVKPYMREGGLVILHDMQALASVHKVWYDIIPNLFIPVAHFVGAEKPLGIGVAQVV